MVNLRTLRRQGIESIENGSCLVNDLDGEEKFDCTGVFGLENEELEALFSGIRNEWQEFQELSNFIKMDTVDENLRIQLHDYLQNLRSNEHNSDCNPKPTQPLESSKPPEEKPPFKFKWIIGAMLSISGVILGARSLPYLTKPKLEADSITIGTLWTPEAQSELSNHLEETLVPKNYIDFITGKKIEVIVNGDKTLPYQEAQNRISNYRWDIAFATSPVISIFAKDSDYKFVAVMFPDSEVYQSGLIVNQDSPIQSIDDIKPEHTIALGSLGRSASSFFMPVYDLYGKTLNIDYGNRGGTIKEKVVSGEADIGAIAITSFEPGIDIEDIEGDDKRLIHQSRNIPSSAVYLSPRLSSSDQETLNQVLLNAPEEVKKFENSNYGKAEEPDFTEFRKVMNRVNDILICSNFSENPVQLFCPEGFEPTTIMGKVNGWTARNNSILLKLTEEGGDIYNVNVSRQLLEQVTGTSTPSQLQDQIIELTVPKEKIKNDNETFIVNINQPAQLNLKNNSSNSSVNSDCPSELSLIASNVSKISEYEGCQAKVTGLVYSTFQPASGNLILLNLGNEDYTKAFQVVVFKVA
jgi:serine/threonine-protein kinase